MNNRKAPSGFTIIELLVVIVVLCILATLVAFTYSGIQSKNRNAERKADIDSIKGQLESYYAQTNTYPTQANLADPDWRSKNLQRLKESALEDPNWSAHKDCTVKSKPSIATKPTTNCYSYQVTATDSSACDNVKLPCAHYTLTAQLEGGEKYTKASLN